MFKSKLSRTVLMIGIPVIIFLLALSFLNAARATAPVLVVNHPLQPGSRMDGSAVTLKELPKAAILPGAFTDAADIVGQTVTVGRLPGDQITADMVGPAALSAIAASLSPDHRAVAVRLTRASGLAGMLQNGDRVTVVGLVDPQTLSLPYTFASPFGEGEEAEEQFVPSPVAMVTVPNLRVLLVPQSFRYQEAMPGQEEELLPAFTSERSQESGVVLLDVPLAPQPIAPGGPEMSPAELLPLLDAYGRIYLLLDPLQADYTIPPDGANLLTVYETMVFQAQAVTTTLPISLEVAP
ncbi:MAG: Flp pilus assembly protein CpaB [Gemmatimonadetes bacterium]|nr:Flp pilus assembly protein CpaB [Gemmatimonadota bacterium]